MAGKRFFLIDGHSLLYRSYYAIRRLSNSKGFPTNAIFGFVNVLRKLIARDAPDYLAVVFDVKGPTVRHEVFKEYKARRKPMPDDLQVQLPVLKDVLKALRIPAVEFEKYEADDVMATLARQAAAEGLETVIVTTDKDLLQAIGDTTVVYNPAKEVTIDRESVRSCFGVAADQVIDVLALWGDPSDNIPGVPGIGEKTAKALVSEYGSLDRLLENLSSVKNPRIREKIAANRDVLELSRRLVTVRSDLPMDAEIESYAVEEPDAAEAARLFKELEFSSLAAAGFAARRRPTERDYRTVAGKKDLDALAARLEKAGLFALDTETDSPTPTRARLVGMSFSLRPGEAFYLPLGHDYPGAPAQIPKAEALAVLRKALEDPKTGKVGQNIKYDAIVLRREGLDLRGIQTDSMVLSYLLEPNWGKHSLERLAASYLQVAKTPYEEVAGKGKKQVPLNRVAVDRVAPYACQDADLALELGSLLTEKVRERGLLRLYEDIERPLIGLLVQMELWGVRVDSSVLESLSREFGEDLKALEKKIHELAGAPFNINSPIQLREVLFHKLGLPPSKKTKITKGYATSLDILEDLALRHPLPRHVLEYRQISKLKSTYADALPLLVNPETGRIHTSYNQTVAATGRLSSSDPNLQNIPARGERGARFRRAFVPEDGHLLLAADYSQIELRVLAHLSGDPRLLETFREDRDIHEETALRVFGTPGLLDREELRRRAKIINFSVVYGTSAFSLAKELGTTTGEAQKFIDRYFDRYPKVREYLDRIVHDAGETGYSETLLGRQRQVPELRQSNRTVQQAGRRIALNTPIQGSAADLMKIAMLRIWDDLRGRKLKTRMILQVHDELVFEVPLGELDEVEAVVRDRMENVFPLSVPLTVRLGRGPSWADAK
jgi:DNA polymerase-1